MKRIFVTLLLVFTAALSYAGQLAIRDEDGLLYSHPQIDVASQSVAFDTLVLISSKRGHGAPFDSFADHLVSGPNMAVIAVDPQGHHTHISTGRGFATSTQMLGGIATSSNGDFRGKDWDGGIRRMITLLESEKGSAPSTAASTASEPALPVQQPQPIQAQKSGGMDWLLVLAAIVLIVSAVVGFVVWYENKKRRQAGNDEQNRSRGAQGGLGGGSSFDSESYSPSVYSPYSTPHYFGYTQPYVPVVPVMMPPTPTVDPNPIVESPSYIGSSWNNTPPPAPTAPAVHHSSGSSDWGSPSPSPEPSSSSSSSSGSSDWGSFSSDSSSSSSDSSSSFDSGSSSSGGSDW